MNPPVCAFYLLGMGGRRKLLYKAGRLLEALTGRLLRAWDVARQSIRPAEYRVELVTRDGEQVRLFEDERGVWVEEGGRRACLTAGPVNLPRFDGHPQAPLLRAALQEVLINIVAGRPVPNLLSYPRPWYRDAAMMLLCLQETGNLHLVADWVRGLREPFDRNNAGVAEPDNLGEALYMISAVAGRHHPLVPAILKTIPQFRRSRHIVGPTDGAQRPVYQTKWLKFGLRSLALEDPYEVPAEFDPYSALFWMDYRQAHVRGEGFDERARQLYPYLAWAEAHFHGESPPAGVELDRYPLTWEAHASEADFDRMAVISEEHVRGRICAPHAWHAAEIFLYYRDSNLQAQSPSAAPTGAREGPPSR